MSANFSEAGVWPRLSLLPAARPVLAAPPDPTDRLADELASRIRSGDYESMFSLARVYRPELEMLGHVRSQSTEDATLRRLQEFLNRHVYGVRVPVAELPRRVRVGLRTGGIRKI